MLKDVNNYAKEVKMLQKLRTLDPERNNLVRFMDSFIVDDMSCIAFECLDRSLLDLMLQRKKRLTLNEIRPITHQLLVALNALKGIGLLYTDLKLDNVMLVNHQDEPFRVKLIDFGLAMTASEVWEGMIVQPYAYRAPEVSLGLPISEAIDMWSLGCLLASLFLCQNIFNGESSYDVMNTICCLLGQPQDHLLDAGKYTHQYFKRKRCTRNSRWRLKTPEEYDDQLQLLEGEFDQIGNLADAVNVYSDAIDEVEVEDTRAFLNLLQMLLNPDAEMRITPEEALEHSFVTMSHLADYAHRSSYTQAAFDLMVVCPACDSDECHEYLSDFESNTESSDSGEVFTNMDNTRTEELYCMESNCDTPTSPEPLQEKVLFILNNKSVRYKVLEFIGEGTFGKVAKCVNMNTNENTAIKILKDVNYYAWEVK
ncbi:protein kinase, partial [Escherichia coli]|nr:protein kinase [Escherichia coli]